MRRALIAGNWKMHKLPSDAGVWMQELGEALAGSPVDCDLVLNVPATHIPVMAARLDGSEVRLGGQDLSAHEEGAYTGEISGAMLRDAGAAYVIVGHSERRSYHHEDDELVNRKVLAARESGLLPIVCVGESEEQRDGGDAEAVVLRQLDGALAGVNLASADDLVIAYEPVWAIGTGRTATAEDAQAMSATIREALGRLYPGRAEAMRILYGGSMKPGNAAELLAQPDVDGGLVGGASLVVSDLLSIARAARG